MNLARIACAAACLALLAMPAAPARAAGEFRAVNFGDFVIELPRHWPGMRATTHDETQQVPENEIATLYSSHAWANDGQPHATLRLGIVHGPNFSQREVNDAASTPRPGIDKALDQLDWKIVAAYGKGDDPGKAQLVRRSIDIKGAVACFLFTLTVDGPRGNRNGYTWWCPDGDRAVVIQALYDKADDAGIFPVVSQVRNSLALIGGVTSPAADSATVLDELARTPASMLDLGMYRLELLAQRLDFSALGIAGATALAAYPVTSAHYAAAGPLVALRLDLQEKSGQKDKSPDKTCAAALVTAREQLRATLPQAGALFRSAALPEDSARNGLPASGAQDILLVVTVHPGGGAKAAPVQESCEGLLAGYETLTGNGAYR